MNKKPIENMPDSPLLRVAASPFAHHPDNTRILMLDVIIALLPSLIWGIYIFGQRAAVITLISVISCVGFEFLTRLILKRPLAAALDLSAVVTGVLIAMNLPASVSFFIPVVGSFFAIVIVKQLFGGLGKNVVNPALAARVFLFSWTSEMTRFTAPSTAISPFSFSVDSADIVASATPLSLLKHGQIPDVSLWDLLIGNCGGTVGEVASLLLILGGIYLLFRRVITWHIPVAFIGTVAVLTFIFARTGTRLEFMTYELLSGGLLLGAFFMATDYVTSPVTPRGRIIYGIGCGAITVFIRYFGGYNEGVSFGILIMNLFVWYLDSMVRPRRFGETKKGLPFLRKTEKTETVKEKPEAAKSDAKTDAKSEAKTDVKSDEKTDADVNRKKADVIEAEKKEKA